ncbi:cytochrome oxidase assembly, partial [Sistotremastrum suecicum HHB10207 ss-3]
TSRVVGFWLLGCSALVFAIVVVGGITRLTESGLSITEWKPVTGVWWPASEAEWMEEFTKYKQSPEFKMLNSSIDIENFKRIYYMEWLHRILGRVLGVAFILPAIYFTARGKLARKDIWRVGGLSLLIGFQGFLGWYMVKSGLDESITQVPGAVPRVSQYRLAAHLGAAFTLYAGMFAMALRILRDHKFARGTLDLKSFAGTSGLAPFRRYAGIVTGLVFITALSGAFVAGLDAGLIYNEFPYMGENIVPPVNELLSSDYAKGVNSDNQYWRNIFENPTTVQFDHRLLATLTYVATTSLALASLHPNARRILPTSTKRLLMGALVAVNAQVVLGISTLLMLVPVHLAATHQAGSVILLTTLLGVLSSLRKPSQLAQLVRR